MMSKIRIKIGMIILFSLLFISASAHGEDTEDYIIWTQMETTGISLNLSSKQEGIWSSLIFTVEESQNPIIVPTLSVNPNGDIWVAWTELRGDQGRLRYRIKENGKWGTSDDLITKTTSDMAPSICLDTDGVPWMVWSGTDETDDDIYASRWLDGQWQAPEIVNEDDGWPDILPIISVDEQNRITVTWQGYNGKRYVQYTTYWTDQGWSPEEVMDGESKVAQNPAQDIPEFVPFGSQGAVFRDTQARKFKKNQ